MSEDLDDRATTDRSAPTSDVHDIRALTDTGVISLRHLRSPRTTHQSRSEHTGR